MGEFSDQLDADRRDRTRTRMWGDDRKERASVRRKRKRGERNCRSLNHPRPEPEADACMCGLVAYDEEDDDV